MIEEELAKEASKGKSRTNQTKMMFVSNQNKKEEKSEASNIDITSNNENKKAYLKRKNDTAQKSQTSTTKKNYKYYVDNFQTKKTNGEREQSGKKNTLNSN